MVAICELIESTPFFFIATSFGDYTDCSLKSGVPGFVKIVAPGTIDHGRQTCDRHSSGHVAPPQRLHHPTQPVGPPWRHQQVDVVVHQHIGVHIHAL